MFGLGLCRANHALSLTAELPNLKNLFLHCPAQHQTSPAFSVFGQETQNYTPSGVFVAITLNLSLIRFARLKPTLIMMLFFNKFVETRDERLNARGINWRIELVLAPRNVD